ncbi:MAG TPA: ROK family protein [Pyrinomonadaceae bacterium]
MNEKRYVLAADVGGTNLRIAAVGSDGKLLHQTSTSTPRDGTADEIVEAIVGAASSCLSRALVSGKPSSFGLALAALVDPRTGSVYSSPNLPQLDGLPLANLISTLLDTEVVLENDATAAAIGESWLGASAGIENSICLTIGTGIGGGLILNGRTYRGVGGTAGELGHICVEADGVPCGCGSRGCLEQYSSATAVVRIARELAGKKTSQWNLADRFTAKDVYHAAVAGDPVAIETFQIVGRYLGIALADIVNVLNPEMIVLGGGGAGSWDFFIEATWSEIRERAFSHPAEAVEIVRASLGGNAGILGAASVAFDRARAR